MQPIQLESAVTAIIKSDPRFQPGAFFLVREALDFTVDRLAKESQGEKRHVTGRELLTGFRDYAIQEYGPMVWTLLEDWGIKSCRNVGEIVFLFIEHGVFGKQDSDSLDDFSEIYTFEEAFVTPFIAA
ncbi:Minf_1886 family protein [Verrucomicrobiaceae bacterium 227]